MKVLQTYGAKCIVLTLGENGLLYCQLLEKEGSSKWSEIKHLEAEKVEVVDTTVRNRTHLMKGAGQ